jgi:hypothetical protein
MYYIRKSALIDKETSRVNDNFSLSVNHRGPAPKKHVIPPYHPLYNVPINDDDDDDEDMPLIVDERGGSRYDDDYRRSKFVDDKYSEQFK